MGWVSSIAQDCPNLVDPLQGATNVPVETAISWEPVVGVNGYLIALGTTPGGSEIVEDTQVGNDTSFTPPLGLPENTVVYVTITLFFFNQDNIVCPSKSFTTEDVMVAPGCTNLSTPINGATGVNVATSISWNYAVKATGYRLSLGTTPGGTEILNAEDVGNVLTYNPPADLPPDTTIYVRVGPFNENGIALGCDEESFTTAGLGEPPGCTQLISPVDGSSNVPLSPLIEWQPVPNATGYKVFIGKTPFVNDILDGAIFTETSTFVLGFEPNNTYFVRIIPFNNAGDALGCEQESFSTILGCGPFIDPDTGQIVTFFPESEMPEVIGICEGELPTTFESPDTADGYRWFKINQDGEEVLISETRTVDLSETGLYVYEVYNIVTQSGFSLECPVRRTFEVTLSERPSIEEVEKVIVNQLFTITIVVSGIGDYEYSIDNENFTDNNFFVNIEEGNYTITVRDKNGCGIAEEAIVLGFPLPGFPPYFSPNGDGINDTWQYRPPIAGALVLRRILIYDRFGKLLATVSRFSEGWDGTYNGTPMPADGYWYKAETISGKEIRGYFSLVR